MTVLVEACVTSPSEVDRAVAHGAHRLELCADLHLDGVTPPPELLRSVLARVDDAVPVFAMVRPTSGPHTCPPEARTEVLDSVRACVDMGAAGIVAGFLEVDPASPDLLRPDLNLMARIVEAAAPATVTFHKAFDLVRDRREAAVALRDTGVARILTAGGHGSAVENLAALRALVALQDAGRGPEVIAAGGIRGSHVRQLVVVTGAEAVHARASAIPGIVHALVGSRD